MVRREQRLMNNFATEIMEARKQLNTILNAVLKNGLPI